MRCIRRREGAVCLPHAPSSRPPHPRDTSPRGCPCAGADKGSSHLPVCWPQPLASRNGVLLRTLTYHGLEALCSAGKHAAPFGLRLSARSSLRLPLVSTLRLRLRLSAFQLVGLCLARLDAGRQGYGKKGTSAANS